MKAYSSLPDGYEKIYSVDLQKDKKIALLINAISILVVLVLVLPMLSIVPFETLYSGVGEDSAFMVRLVSLLLLMVVYIVLHELVHGIAMKICGTKTVKYGFTGLYAFAGSDDYYDKSSYIFIAIAPVVLWGIVLALVNIFVPVEWFWVVYLIQIFNLSGAAGDYYVTAKFLKFPKDIIIKDSGVGMEVFSRIK